MDAAIQRGKARTKESNATMNSIAKTDVATLPSSTKASAWIQNNLYLSLADAPFDREDPTLNPAAGACVTCPRRSGYNTSLFCDVQGDQCMLCGIWATASLSCWLPAAAPPTA